MIEKILNRFGYIRKSSRWEKLLSIEPPRIEDRNFFIACDRIVIEEAFHRGINWLITDGLKKVTEENDMMNKDVFQLLMAGILATDNVRKQFQKWASQVREEEEDYDEHAVI